MMMDNRIKPSEVAKGHPDDDPLAEYMRMYKQSQSTIHTLEKEVGRWKARAKKQREKYWWAMGQLEKFVDALGIFVEAGDGLVEEGRVIPVLDRPEMEELRKHRAKSRTPRYRE